DVQVGGLKTLALQFTHGVEHGLVLGLDRDDVLAAGLVEVRRALEREVVRFGRAGGPDDLARVGADQFGHLDAGLFDGLFGFPAISMRAGGGVAEVLTQPRDHGVDDARVHRGGGAVVHVNREVGGHVHDATRHASVVGPA